MSQYHQQDISAAQANRSQTSPGISATPSPASKSPNLSSRGQPGQSIFSNTLIPRDYLASNSDAQSSRKAKPSPLQSTHLPQSPPTAQQAGLSSQAYTSRASSDRITNGNGADNSIRTARIGVMAPGQGHHTSNAGTQSPESEPSKTMSRAYSGSSRGQQVQSPPDSPVSPISLPKNENGRMILPRNSSLDSAISTISSATNNSGKASTSASQVTTAEISNLVATAGTPENLIAYLLNEKQHAANQNAQLWKLVDKQRSLLLGLNKDLEQVSKDKEKYRKKVKELQAQGPALPSMSALRGTNTGTSGTEARDEATPKHERNQDSLGSDLGAMSTPQKTLAAHPESSPIDPAMMPSPLHTLQLQRQENENLDISSNTRERTNDALPQLRLTDALEAKADTYGVDNRAQSSFTTSMKNTDFARRPPGVGLLQTMMAPPAVNLIEPSPLAEKPEKGFPTTKRPKPAPLNLNQSKRGSMLLQNLQLEDHSDSDYDDLLETDDERGRRKTREEDDRDREVVAQKESEARSRSNRGTSAQANQEPPITKTELVVPKLPANGLPVSPRPIASRAFSDETTGRLLSPQTGRPESSNIPQRHLTAPPRSPGLPTSPRPVNRPTGSPPRGPFKENAGTVNSLPLSPRNMPSGMPLSPRAPRQPLPPHNPDFIASSALASPGLVKPPIVNTHLISPPFMTSAQRDQNNVAESPESPAVPQVFKGYIDANYPRLLLPPNALPSIIVKVSSPRLRPSRQSFMGLKTQEDAHVFMLSVYSRFDGKELWRAEKVILALSQLDQQFRAVIKTPAKLPDRRLFAGHSPAIVDARRAAVDSYFNDLLDSPMNEKAALIICHFLSTDVIEPGMGETNLLAGPPNGSSTLTTGPDGRPRKEGYLTKRGKNFGGWKARFFVLHGTDFRYFEAPGGAHLGTIKLLGAQIGKQSSSDSPALGGEDAENQYRHAFLILEPKRKDSTSLVRHVLCAESDRERDDWVAALLHYVDEPSDEESSAKGQTEKRRTAKPEPKSKIHAGSTTLVGKDDVVLDNLSGEDLKAINYADTSAGATPFKRAAAMDRQIDTPSPTSTSSTTTPHSVNNVDGDQQSGIAASKMISSPTNGGIIQNAEAWGNKPVAASNFKENYHKKRGIWNFRQKSSSDLSAQDQLHSSESNTHQAQHSAAAERKAPARAVFGLPLAEAVELCPPEGIDANLPAVVYRCLEYLRAKNAASEEGLFRLSGSNLVVKALKERFNSEGDVNLVADGHYHDVHAVASLFKTYLRELPSTVLTRELHLEFLAVLEIDNKPGKIAAFKTLVHRLPPVNFSLLRVLSQYLLEVVNNSDKNKMGVRNVGIVFSPTLNIPAPVFAAFLSDFDAIFEGGAESAMQTRSTEVNVPESLAPVDIRSPRHQMFSDLPTPGYNQTSFGQGASATSFTSSTGQPHPLTNGEAAQDVGFMPMQQSYETRQYVSKPHLPQNTPQRFSVAQPPPPSQGEYGSLNMMMSPDNAPTVKAKRRESSMLFM